MNVPIAVIAFDIHAPVSSDMAIPAAIVTVGVTMMSIFVSFEMVMPACFNAFLYSSMFSMKMLGHIDDIKNDTFKHETATLYRIFNIGGKNIGIYNPTWMG